MNTFYFEEGSPSGKVLIDLREFGINMIRWVRFLANRTFQEKGMCEKMVESLQNDPDNEGKILIVVHDTSDLVTYPYRYFIQLRDVYEEEADINKSPFQKPDEQ